MNTFEDFKKIQSQVIAIVQNLTLKKETFMRISSEKIQKVLYELFVKYNFSQDKAEILASTFTESTLDGVSSHGLNRVPLFIDYIEKGIIKIDAEAKKQPLLVA